MKSSAWVDELSLRPLSRPPLVRFLILSFFVALLATIVPVRAAPDFELNANIPFPVDTAHQSVATITVTAVYGFTGTVNLSKNSTQGLSCNPFNPASITLDGYTGSGTASLSCNAPTPGLYNVTVTGISGAITHTTRYTANFTAAPSSRPQMSIFGLSPTAFYAIVGGIIAIALVASYVAVGRRKPTGPENGARQKQ